jgi:hypothetical protein
VVAGDLSWTFTDPCLTTTEARGVGSWLREIVRGVAGPEAPWTTEPNVRFSLVERTDSLATVRVAFSQESSPPGSNEDIQFGAGYPVDVVLSLTDLLTAANEWDHELERLPVR